MKKILLVTASTLCLFFTSAQEPVQTTSTTPTLTVDTNKPTTAAKGKVKIKGCKGCTIIIVQN